MRDEAKAVAMGHYSLLLTSCADVSASWHAKKAVQTDATAEMIMQIKASENDLVETRLHFSKQPIEGAVSELVLF